MVIISLAQKSPKGRKGEYVKFDDGTVYASGTVGSERDPYVIVYSGSGQLKEADRIIDDGVAKRAAYHKAAE